MINYMQQRKKQRGMTMLEVVVSMLVCGLGLAMTVSMMQASQRFGSSAEYRALALREVQSIIDNMRSNRLGAKYYVEGESAKDYNPCALFESAEAKAACKETSKNIAKSVAVADLASWKGHIATSLPSGTGEVVYDNVRGMFTTTVTWNLVKDQEVGNDEAEADNDQEAGNDKAKADNVSVRFVL